MKRFHQKAALVAAACLLVPVLSGCVSSASATAGPIAVAGATRVDPVVVKAPVLTQPVLDVTVGIASLQTPAAVAARHKAASAQRARGPVVAGTLREVRVRAGDTVRKGQVIAVFDDRMLRAGVESAQAAYRRSIATADTMKSSASELRDQRAKIRSARRTLLSQQAMLNTQSGKLRSQLVQLQAQIPQLEAAQAKLVAAQGDLKAKLAEAEKLAASPTPPPGIGDVVAQLRGALGKVTGQLAGVRAALVKLRAAVPQLKAVLGKMSAGSAAMASAKAKIASALSKMSDGISQLNSASSVLRMAAAAQSTGVAMAKYALSQATVVAPTDGVVLSARPTGQTVVVGAPIATIRPAGDVLVDVYLSPEQAARVKVGDPAEVTVDSVKGAVPGRVAVVGTTVEFPPANYPTQIVHLANTVHVTVSAPGTSLPVGVPADVVVRPSS